MGGKGSGRSTRSFLYQIAKIIGDLGAIFKGQAGRRARRRITGRWLSRLMKVILLGSLLIPVYEGTSIVPKFYIKKSPNGVIRIYEPGQLLIPKYIIRDNRVYDPGKPLIPLLDIKPKERGQEK